jgi:hypothetical protein
MSFAASQARALLRAITRLSDVTHRWFGFISFGCLLLEGHFRDGGVGAKFLEDLKGSRSRALVPLFPAKITDIRYSRALRSRATRPPTTQPPGRNPPLSSVGSTMTSAPSRRQCSST